MVTRQRVRDLAGKPLVGGQPNTLIEDAYRRIKRMIFDHKVVPGQRLITKDLVESLGMSRTPIINALNRLVQDGFVGFESFRGFFVRPIDPQEVWDSFGVREALESHALEQAIKIGDPEGLKILEEKLKEHGQYSPPSYTQQKFKLDSAFHLHLAAMSQNRVLKWLLKRNLEHIYLRARLETYPPQRMKDSYEEHRKIFAAVKRKDIIKGVALIRTHIQNARDNVLSCLEAEEPRQKEIG